MVKNQTVVSLPGAYHELFDYMRANVPVYAGENNSRIIQRIIREYGISIGIDVSQFLAPRPEQ